jgi:hypothetical protein
MSLIIHVHLSSGAVTVKPFDITVHMNWVFSPLSNKNGEKTTFSNFA